MAEYLAASGHGGEADPPLFRRIRPPKAGALTAALTPVGVYSEVFVHYMKLVGITRNSMDPHALRATAANSTPEH